jgi:hypothetical protein
MDTRGRVSSDRRARVGGSRAGDPAAEGRECNVEARGGNPDYLAED